MKIENKVHGNHKTFGELEYGDVFIFADGVFMKIETDDSEYNAVSLEEGYALRLFLSEKIRLIKATLIIE